MNRSLLSTALLFFAIAPARAGTTALECCVAAAPVQNPQEAPKAATALTFPTTTFDFGKIKDDAPVKTKFRVVNESKDSTMTVREVHPSCGCVTFNLAKSTFAPGEGGEIEITYNPMNRQGKDQKSVTVVVDDPAKSRVDLVIKAEVVPRVRIEPMSLYLGECRHDKIADAKITRKVTLSSRTPEFKVTGAEIRDTRVAVRAVGVEGRMVDGESETAAVFEVSVPKNIPIGRVQSQIDFTTNDPQRSRIAVAIIFDSVGELRFSQTPIWLRMPTPGAPVTYEVGLGTRSNVPFKVRAIRVKDCPKMALTAEVAPMTGDGSSRNYRVVLKGTAPEGGTMVTGTLIIETDLVDEPVFEAPFSGLVPAAEPAPAKMNGH